MSQSRPSAPYDTYASVMAQAELRTLLERSVDFDALGQQSPDVSSDPDRPLLLLGAVDVVSGEFKAFDSRRGEITADAVLASAAIPTLFRSVHADGGVYWDGLSSQNPPVRDLLDVSPGEIWVIQILAAVIRDVAAKDPNLTGPARAMSHRANADIDHAADPGHQAADVAWVTPGDVLANRTVSIPEPVRAGLVHATDALVQTASNAMSAAACLDRATQDAPSGPGQEPTPPRSRRHERPTPITQDVPRAARP